MDLSTIKIEPVVKEEKVPLDSDSLLTLTYWFFVIIACLLAIGLAWDFWMYYKRKHAQQRHGKHGDADGSQGIISKHVGVCSELCLRYGYEIYYDYFFCYYVCVFLQTFYRLLFFCIPDLCSNT